MSHGMNGLEVVLQMLEPVAAKQKIRERGESIGKLVEDVEDMNCFAGFDQRLPDVVFLNPEDENFFAGKINSNLYSLFNIRTRQVLGLESADVSNTVFEALVDQITKVVRLFPVVGFVGFECGLKA